MVGNLPRSMLRGIIAGLCIATAVTLLVWINQDDHGALQAIISFFASVPALLLFAQFSMPEFFQFIVLFIYWGMVGGILGWLAGKRQAFHRIAVFVLLVVILFSHLAAQVMIQREFDAVIDGIVETLFGRTAP